MIDQARVLRVYRCTLVDANAMLVINGSHDQIRWLKSGDWLNLTWLPVDREAVEALLKYEDGA